MTHDNPDDAGAPYHSRTSYYIDPGHDRYVRCGYTLFVVSGKRLRRMVM